MDFFRLVEDLAIYDWINVIALIVCIYNFFTKRKGLPFLGGFLFFVFIFEIVIINYFTKVYHNNLFAYTVFALACVLYYAFVYLDYLKNYTSIKIGIYVMLLWFAASVAFHLCISSFTSIPYIIGLLIMIFFILQYFKILIENQKLLNYKKEALFYFSIGILFFFCCTLPMLLFLNFLIIDNKTQVYFSILMMIGNIFLSLGYLGAALCSKR